MRPSSSEGGSSAVNNRRWTAAPVLTIVAWVGVTSGRSVHLLGRPSRLGQAREKWAGGKEERGARAHVQPVGPEGERGVGQANE
jgi:hypothetical protein